jgi:hypothetical protein
VLGGTIEKERLCCIKGWEGPRVGYFVAPTA